MQNYSSQARAIVLLQAHSSRLLTLVLLVAGLFLLAACGSGAATQTEEAPTSEPTSAPTSEPTAESNSASETAAPASTDNADDTTSSDDTSSDDTGSEDTGSEDTGSEDTGSEDTGSEDTVETEPTPQPEPTSEPTPAGPVTLSSGEFNFIDNLHNGTGTASIIEQPDGTRILRLGENFSVTEGPSLFVWLSGHSQPVTEGETINDGWIDLGVLQSRNGVQEYVIPADVDLNNYQSALIWCEDFRQVMTSAELIEE